MIYFRIIQQNFGQGWEDVSEYETDSQGRYKEFSTTKNGKRIPLIKLDLKEYQLTGYPTRIISRREKKLF